MKPIYVEFSNAMNDRIRKYCRDNRYTLKEFFVLSAEKTLSEGNKNG